MRLSERVQIAQNLLSWLTRNVPVPDESYGDQCSDQVSQMLSCLGFASVTAVPSPVTTPGFVHVDVAVQLPGPTHFVFMPVTFRVGP